MDSQAPVAIVGGGIGGLVAANRLSSAGINVVVFDKGRGVAGRMSTRITERGHAFDHGAQYFTARDPGFKAAVAEWRTAGVVAEWQATIGTLRDGGFEPDTRSNPRYVGVPGNNAVCVHLASNLNVRSGVTVGSCQRTDDGWRLVDQTGERLGNFRWLVTTAPAPQSAELFTEAPTIAEQAQRVKMTGCWAVMVAFEESLGLPYHGAFVEDSPLSWIANNNSKPGRLQDAERWVLHGSPEWSEANIELDPATATDQLLAAFWQAVGLPPVSPIYARAHRWRYALPPEPLAEPCLFDAEVRVGACGDWCGGPRVEGAYLSGVALADKLGAAV